MVKKTHFASIEEIKATMTRELKGLTEEDFPECLHRWQRGMQKCINSGGITLMVTMCNFSVGFMIKNLRGNSGFFFVTPRRL